MRTEVSTGERLVRWALLGLGAFPLVAKLLGPLMWRTMYGDHLDEVPMPTEFLFDGWPALASLTVLVVTFAAARLARRRVVQLGSVVCALVVLFIIAMCSGFALAMPWFSWGGRLG